MAGSGKILEIGFAVCKAAWEILTWFGWQKPLLSLALATATGTWSWFEKLSWSTIAVHGLVVFGVSLLMLSAPRFYRVLAVRDPTKPDYAAWKFRSRYGLWQASYLLADRTPDLEPKFQATPDVRGWYDALTNAIADGEIIAQPPFQKSVNGVGIVQPDSSVSAQDLWKFCARRGVLPKFMEKPPELGKLPGVSVNAKMGS